MRLVVRLAMATSKRIVIGVEQSYWDGSGVADAGWRSRAEGRQDSMPRYEGEHAVQA
jgi:hypothetical protein